MALAYQAVCQTPKSCLNFIVVLMVIIQIGFLLRVAVKPTPEDVRGPPLDNVDYTHSFVAGFCAQRLLQQPKRWQTGQQ